MALTSDGRGPGKYAYTVLWTAVVVGRCSRLLPVVVANLEGHVRTFHNRLEIQMALFVPWHASFESLMQAWLV